MRNILVLAVAGAIGLASIGCGGASLPLSPDTAVAAGAGAQGAAASMTLAGNVRGLNVQTRTFTLATASGGARLIKADETTRTWIGGKQARFGSLQNGMNVSVAGTDLVRYVLAATIVSR